MNNDPAIELNMRMPWLTAPEASIWQITGTYPKGAGTFTDCLAFVLPEYVTGGPVLFKMFGGGLDDVVSADQITRARELILVDASNPTEAYYARDQALIDHHRGAHDRP